MDTSGIILAGGKSLRFGHNKIVETIGQGNLLSQVISCISTLCQEIIIVTRQEQVLPQLTEFPEVKIVTDIIPDKGPLGGIHTGLLTSPTFYNLVVAADMPFLNQSLLKYMLSIATGSDIVMPTINNQFEPLHAIYSQNCLAPAEDLIRQNRLFVIELFDFVKVRYVSAEEIDRFDPKHLSFFNINTMPDLKKARELARGDRDNDKR